MSQIETAESLLKNPKKQLASIVDTVNHLKQLQAILAEHIEPNLASHCHIAGYEENILTIVADTNAWATRLRYAAPDITHKLKKTPHFKGIKSIKNFVQLKPHPVSRKIKKPQKLNQENAAAIKSIATGIQNELLQKALLQLAENKL